MKKTYNQETGKTKWEITEWYQKFIYWFGLIGSVYFAIAFMIGFINALIQQ